MRSLTTSAVALFLALGIPVCAPSQAQTNATTASPVELQISGPRLIRVGEDLHFNVTLINRSNAPIALSFVRDGWADSDFQWTITDSADRTLPPPARTGPQGFFCLMQGAVPEDRIQVLQPGEKYVYAKDADPSSEFAFHGKGFYKVKLRYLFEPALVAPIAVVANEWRGSPDATGPYPKRELLLETPQIHITSNVWTMYLTD